VRTGSRGTLWVLASLLGVAVFVVTTVSGCASSPDPTTSATTGPTPNTSSTNASTAPTPSTSPPPPAEPSAVTSTTPAPKPTTRAPAPKPTTRALAPVQVQTTFAGWNTVSGSVEVGGYATVVEPVGSCTLRLTRGDRVVIRRHIASQDATTVACGGFSVPRTELTPGAWKAALSYTSARSTGEAAAVTVTVP
jgi:hypothetical protein